MTTFFNAAPCSSEKIGGRRKATQATNPSDKRGNACHFSLIQYVLLILVGILSWDSYFKQLGFLMVLAIYFSVVSMVQWKYSSKIAPHKKRFIAAKIYKRLTFFFDTLIIFLLVNAAITGLLRSHERVRYAARKKVNHRVRKDLKPTKRSYGRLLFVDEITDLKYDLELDYGSDNPCFYQTLLDLSQQSTSCGQRLREYLAMHENALKTEEKTNYSMVAKVLSEFNIPYVRLTLDDENSFHVLRTFPKRDPLVVLIDHNPRRYPKHVDFFRAQWDEEVGHIAYITRSRINKMKPRDTNPEPQPSSSGTVPDIVEEQPSPSKGKPLGKGKEPLIEPVINKIRPPPRPTGKIEKDFWSGDIFAYDTQTVKVTCLYNAKPMVSPPMDSLERILQQNEKAEQHHKDKDFITTVSKIGEQLEETGVWGGIKSIVCGSVLGMVVGIVELGLSVPKFVENVHKLNITSDDEDPDYYDIFFKTKEGTTKGMTHIVNNGLFQGNKLEEVISKNGSDVPHSDTYRFLGIDTTFEIPEEITNFTRYLKIDLGDRWGIGGIQEWYPKMNTRLFKGNIVFKNCGPLHPMTAWKLWNYHSNNSNEEIVGVFWDSTLILDSYDFNDFSFPNFVDHEGGWTYSWESFDSEMCFHSTTYETALDRKNINICSDMSDIIMDGKTSNVFDYGIVGRGKLYLPVRQEIVAKCQPKEENIEEFEVHRHFIQRGANIEPVIHYCLHSCCLGDGSRIDIPNPAGQWNRGIGLSAQSHTNLIATLCNCKQEAQVLNARKTILSGSTGQLSLNALQFYEAAYLKAAARIRKSWIDPKTIVTHDIVSTLSSLKQSPATDLYYAAMKKDHMRKKDKRRKAKELMDKVRELIQFQTESEPQEQDTPKTNEIQYGHRLSNKLIDSIITNYETKNLDYDDLMDALWKVHIKKPVLKLFAGGEPQLEVIYAAKKSKGVPLEEKRHRDKQCTHCRRFAPDKFKWVKGYCESCWLYSRNNLLEEQVRAGDNLHFMPDLNHTYLHSLAYPTTLKPAIPYYKPKPIRKNLKCNEQYNGKEPGFKVSKKIKQNKTSNGSHLIGIGIRTRGRVLDLGNTEVEEKTLRVRIFAEPLSDATPGRFSKLFEFAKNHGLLGPEGTRIKPLPVIEYCFEPNGNLAKELLTLGIATADNIVTILFKLKQNVDQINNQLWRIENWNGPTWISSFEPRKKAIYYRALLNYGKEKKKGSNLPKIDFSFFLKREVDTHGCDRSGRRPAMNPRIICNPSPISQVLVGPYMRVATKHLHHILSLDNPGTYFGGLGPNDGNTWARRIFDNDFKICLPGVGSGKDYAIIENDFSKFDATYNSDAFKFVYSVYRYWGLPMDNELFMHVLDTWKKPKGRFRSGTLVSAPIMNASGRADTALMNALINYFVQLSAFLEVTYSREVDKISREELSNFFETFRIAVLGDDSLTVVPYKEGMEGNVSDIIQHYGFEARDMKVHRDAKHAVFLGNRLYPVLEGGLPTISWGPTIGRRMFKMGTATDIQDDPTDWLRQTSEATIIQAGFVPILGDMARKTFELSRHVYKGNSIKEEKLKYKQPFISNCCTTCDYERIGSYMMEVYSLSVEDLTQMYTLIHSIQHVPCIITCPLFDALVTKDTGG